MDLEPLKQIGLTGGEVKIYDALLELGESTRTTLAKRSGISPSKIYDVANRLLEKGIISAVKKNGVMHFAAADPGRLKTFLEQKEEELRRERKLVDELLPQLLLKYQKTEEEADVEVFYGWEGMKTAYDDISKALGPGDLNRVLGASSGQNDQQADIFFDQFYQKKRKRGFGTRIIFNENMRSNKRRTAIFCEEPNELRFLYNDTFTEINMYKETVLFVEETAHHQDQESGSGRLIRKILRDDVEAGQTIKQSSP